MSEADTVTANILSNYQNPKEEIKAEVTGAFQLEPKDRIKTNYKGEINVDNPFIWGVSLLGTTANSGDNAVWAGRTGSIRLSNWIGLVKTIKDANMTIRAE